MKRFLLILAILIMASPPRGPELIYAQGTAMPVAIVVTTCGSLPTAFLTGRSAPLTIDTTGTTC